MISSTLSLDEEAELYREGFFHAAEEAAPRSIVKVPRFGHSISFQSFLTKIVCYRCGQVGHMSSSCSGALPSLTKLEQSLEKDVMSVISARRRDPQMTEDEYGLVSMEMESQVPTKLNWKSSQFCSNCGKAGHRSVKCPHISFAELSSIMKDVLNPHTRVPVKEVEQFFYDLWED